MALRMVGQVWPVLKSDPSPPVFALLVSLPTAVDEINLVAEPPITAAELSGMFKRERVFGAGGDLDDLIRFRGGLTDDDKREIQRRNRRARGTAP